MTAVTTLVHVFMTEMRCPYLVPVYQPNFFSTKQRSLDTYRICDLVHDADLQKVEEIDESVIDPAKLFHGHQQAWVGKLYGHHLWLLNQNQRICFTKGIIVYAFQKKSARKFSGVNLSSKACFVGCQQYSKTPAFSPKHEGTQPSINASVFVLIPQPKHQRLNFREPYYPLCNPKFSCNRELALINLRNWIIHSSSSQMDTQSMRWEKVLLWYRWWLVSCYIRH